MKSSTTSIGRSPKRSHCECGKSAQFGEVRPPMSTLRISCDAMSTIVGCIASIAIGLNLGMSIRCAAALRIVMSV